MKYIKTYEEIDYSDNLYYIVDEDYFTKNGYLTNTHSENDKHHMKTINKHLSIFCRSIDKRCMLDTNSSETIKFIEYYMKECLNANFEKEPNINQLGFYAYYDKRTGEFLNRAEYDLKRDKKSFFDNNFIRIWYVKNTWDGLIEEFNRLTGGFFTKSKYYDNWLIFKNMDKYNL